MQAESGGTERKPRPAVPRPAVEAGAERALVASLRLMIIPVMVLVLAGFGAFAYGIALFVHSVDTIVGHPFPVGKQIGLFLLDIDLFLIGATLLVSAIGLYELFVSEIRPGAAVSVPAWLDMHDLDDLKSRIISMIVMVLAVSFVEAAVDSPGANGQQLVELGGGIALVVVALTLFNRLASHSAGASHRDDAGPR